MNKKKKVARHCSTGRMSRPASWICCTALLLTVAAFRAGADAPLSAEAFGALPAQTDIVLSPNGQRLAWVDHREAKPRVVMFDVPGRTALRILAMPERLKLRSLAWNDDDTLLITLSETVESKSANRRSEEFFLTTAYDAGGGEGRMLPAANGRARGPQAAVLARLERVRITKPHTVIMSSHSACHNGANCLLEVDTVTGNAQLIKAGNELTVGWVVDRNGSAVARIDWDWQKSAYHVYALSGNEIKEILRRSDTDPPTLAGLLPDGSALLLLASNGRPRRAAWALPLDGSPATLVAEDPAGDITGAYEDQYTGAITGVYVEGARTSMHWLDSDAKRRYELLEHAFPGRSVGVYGWTADASKTLALVESPGVPPVYYLVDFTSHRADIAGEEYPGLAGARLGDLKTISYKARDGMDVPAYLTTPPGKAAGPGPLIVLPHGGPNARDYPGFDWIVQFLASRGYTVLQPQFRGSTGFGDAFRDAGNRQWGGLMQDDVTDGVKAMIGQKIADPKRVAIVGISYGGYAALAGAAFTPKLYACAVSISGISDLRALLEEVVPMYGNHVRYYSTALSDWTERIGAPTDPSLATRSPINAIAAISIPILIVYGTGDGVVPNSQSERMAAALKAANKPVTLVKLADEDHWLSRAETRVQLLHELDSFLSVRLPVN